MSSSYKLGLMVKYVVGAIVTCIGLWQGLIWVQNRSPELRVDVPIEKTWVAYVRTQGHALYGMLGVGITVDLVNLGTEVFTPKSMSLEYELKGKTGKGFLNPLTSGKLITSINDVGSLTYIGLPNFSPAIGAILYFNWDNASELGKPIVGGGVQRYNAYFVLETEDIEVLTHANQFNLVITGYDGSEHKQKLRFDRKRPFQRRLRPARDLQGNVTGRCRTSLSRFWV